MEVFKCVSTLSSIRSYVNKQVDPEIINEVLQAGRLAPSAHNDQPWEFILINEGDSLRELEHYCISGRFIAQAGFAVVVLTDPSSKWHEIDGTRAAQNMVLTAWSHALGSCWIGALDRKGLTEYLNIPGTRHILTVLPFGYFDKRLTTSSKLRKSPAKVFHLNKYGQRMDAQ